MSKGSNSRPLSVPYDRFSSQFEAIFGKVRAIPAPYKKEICHATDADKATGNTQAVPSVGAVDQE